MTWQCREGCARARCRAWFSGVSGQRCDCAARRQEAGARLDSATTTHATARRELASTWPCALRSAARGHARCTATVTASAMTAEISDGHAVRAASSTPSDGRGALAAAASRMRSSAPGASRASEASCERDAWTVARFGATPRPIATPAPSPARAIRRRGAVGSAALRVRRMPRTAAGRGGAMWAKVSCTIAAGGAFCEPK